MKKNRFRIFLIAAAILISGYFLFPTFQDYSYTSRLKNMASPDSAKYIQENKKAIDKAQEKRLKLGLDLQGGMHVVLEVDVLQLIENRAKNRDEAFDKIIAEVRKQAKTTSKQIPELLAAEFKKQGVRMSRYYYEIRDTDDDVVQKLQKEAVQAVTRAKDIVRNRVDQFGVAEPSIQTQGGRRIIVELPGVGDKERVRRLLKGTALLEFRLLRDKDVAGRVLQEVNSYIGKNPTVNLLDTAAVATADSATAKPELSKEAKATQDSLAAIPDSLKSKEQLIKENPLFAVFQPGVGNGLGASDEFNKNKISEMFARPDVQRLIPKDLQFVWGAKPIGRNEGVKFYELYALKKEPELTGSVITEARATFGADSNTPEVNMKMNAEGTRVWARVTGANIGKQVAIVLDGTVFSAPVVQSKIPNGSSVINGLEGVEEAQDLENVLKAGALPAPVQIIEERSVGPSLGADSIRAGLYSVLFGFLAVAIFMVVYYHIAGSIADLALVFNIVFVIAFLAGFGATLSLPGIAGIVLTIGMAVDANVLIFERIREESAEGKSLKLSIELGYDRAFSAILDSHVTTFFAGLLLYTFGIGPIQGFAVTLMIGISASLFTAIVITKVVFDWMIEKRTQSDVSFG